MPRKKKTFPYALGFALTLTFTLLSAAGSYHFLRTLHHAWTSASWPETQGTVVYTGVQRYAVARGSPHYYGVVTYRYEVGGQAYRSSHYDARLRPRSFADRESTQAYLAAFALGQQVPAYYHPRRPSTTVLKAGLSSGTLAFTALMGGMFLGLTGLFGWGVARTYGTMRRTRRSKSK